MKLEKAKPRSLVEVVVDQLERAILDGEIRSGEKLPATQELQASLGVGRNTLREALSVLSQKGLVEIRQGAAGGIFVRRLGPDQLRESLALMMRQGKVPWRQLIEFRLDLDAIITRRAAMAATERDIADLQAIVARGRELLKAEPVDWRKLLDIDQRIHYALAGMSRNAIHEWVMQTVLDHMHSYFDVFVRRREEFARRSFDDMARVVEALAGGDVERTVALGQSHVLIGFDYFEEID